MSFFQLDQDKINGYKDILNKLIHEHLPVSSELFTRLGITVDIFMYDWVLTLFSKSLPLEISSRIWDRYILQGDVKLLLQLVLIYSPPPPPPPVR